MLKITVLGMALISAFVITPAAYAGKVELTTYYPAPSGEYDQLTANQSKIKKLAVGSTTLQPITEGNIVLAQQSGASKDPKGNTPPTGRIGEIAYSASKDSFYYNSTGASTGWAPVGGSGLALAACTTVSATHSTYNKNWGAWWNVAYAACPANTKVLSGGCVPHTANGTVEAYGPYSNGAGWFCGMTRDGDDVEAIAYCCPA